MSAGLSAQRVRKAKSPVPPVPAPIVPAVPEAKPPYVPSEREQASLDAIEAARAKRSPMPRITVEKDAAHPTIGLDHPDQRTGSKLLTQAMGSVSGDFSAELVKQLGMMFQTGRVIDEDALNFALSVVAGIQPRDQLEAMLAAQMAAIHCQVMTFSRRLANVSNLGQQDSAERALNKLARTFVAQVEGLKRYRSNGEQSYKVLHQHVHVADGGQAIVGPVHHGGALPGGGADVKGASQPDAITDARSEAMYGEAESVFDALPRSGG